MDNNIFVDDLITQLAIIKSLINVRCKARKSNSFIDIVIYDVSRCLLQDICSYIWKKEPDVDKSSLSWFDSKYREARNRNCHVYQVDKRYADLLLADIEQVIIEIINLLHKTNNKIIIESDQGLESRLYNYMLSDH